MIQAGTPAGGAFCSNKGSSQPLVAFGRLPGFSIPGIFVVTRSQLRPRTKKGNGGEAIHSRAGFRSYFFGGTPSYSGNRIPTSRSSSKGRMRPLISLSRRPVHRRCTLLVEKIGKAGVKGQSILRALPMGPFKSRAGNTKVIQHQSNTSSFRQPHFDYTNKPFSSPDGAAKAAWGI